jgi:Bifunctional DNA primase/polymerase, N-terminal
MAAKLKKAALTYAARLGWCVFPCVGKVPAIRGGRGYLDATTNAQTITSFWTRYPSANIGVSCIGSGFVALDVDPRHGGDETLTELERRHGPLPHTVRQVTGGGGQHILFFFLARLAAVGVDRRRHRSEVARVHQCQSQRSP